MILFVAIRLLVLIQVLWEDDTKQWLLLIGTNVCQISQEFIDLCILERFKC